MIVVIAGPTASGKTTIADRLEAECGATRIRYSMILADIARERGLDPKDKPTLQQLFLSEREQRGEDFLAKEVVVRIKFSKAPLIVIEGARRLVDIETLRALALELGKKLKLVFIEASLDARLGRYNSRLAAAGQASITREAFEELERNASENEVDNLREIFVREGLCLDTSTLTIDESMKEVKAFLGM